MLKKASSFVLASLKASTYGKEYASASRSLRPRWTAFLNILDCGVDPVLARGPAFHDPSRQVFFNTTLDAGSLIWNQRLSSTEAGGALRCCDKLQAGLTASRRSV